MAAGGSDQSGLWRQLALGSGLGLVFFTSIGGGYFLGWLVDRWLHTGPIFGVIFGIVGLAGGLLEILRILKRDEERESGSRNGSSQS